MRARARRSGGNLLPVLGLVLFTLPAGAESVESGASAAERYVETIPNTTVSFEMIPVPDGKFWIGKTEVTWDEYEVWFFKKDLPEGTDASTRPSIPYEPYDQGWGRKGMPAIKITRHAAREYAKWLSGATGREYRLPTEAEWDLACGDVAATDLVDQAWWATNAGDRARPVATLKPNRLGIHDMLGNVWEYVEGDLAADDRSQFLRGGAYDSPEVSKALRIAYDPAWNSRDPQRPRSIWWVCDGPFLGFRLARSAP